MGFLIRVLPKIGAALLALSILCMIAIWIIGRFLHPTGQSPIFTIMAFVPIIALPLSIVAFVVSSVLRVVQERRAAKR